jgi:hypothetical protein
MEGKDTTVSLRDYFESTIADHRRSVEQAKEQMEKRLDGMNEFREQLKDQAAKFITRDEMMVGRQAILEEIKGLRHLADLSEGKASNKMMMITTGIASAGVIIGLLGVILSAIHLMVK